MPQQYIDFAYVKENASFERILNHYTIACRGTGGWNETGGLAGGFGGSLLGGAAGGLGAGRDSGSGAQRRDARDRRV